MPNPAGPESKNEFIENYNPDTTPVSLAGYMISDGDEIDTLSLFPDSSILNLYPGVVIDSFTLPPYGYALIIDREYMDSSDVPHPYNIPPGTVILTTGDNTIGNGLANNDPIFLISPDWDTLDTYGTPANPTDSIPISPPDGISVERINPLAPDEESNWGLSIDSTGSTPGRKNSLTIWHDIGIVRISHSTPTLGEPLHLQVMVKNYGLSEIDSFRLSVTDGFSTSQSLFLHLLHGDSAGVGIETPEITEPSIFLTVSVYLEGDENPANDTVRLLLPVTESPVILNEIMYDDTVEWVEVYNNTSNTISLEGFKIRDASGHTSVPAPSIQLEPHGYFVFVADSTIFRQRFPGTSNFTELDNFPTLNNNYESIVLMDEAGNTVDSLRYSSSWGGSRGVSLERISPRISTNTKENWGSSRASNGGTPGSVNSISNFQESGGLLTFNSKIYHTGDGDFVIKLNTQPQEKVLLYIFDIRGRIIKKLVDGEKGIYLARWDGTDMWGRKVGQGVYIIYCATEKRKEKAVIMVK